MKLYIENLKVKMFLGIYDFEKLKMTDVCFNICIILLEFNLQKKHNINELLNYDVAARLIKESFEGKNYDLIEDVMFECHAVLKSKFDWEEVEIKITKFGTHSFVSGITICKKFLK